MPDLSFGSYPFWSPQAHGVVLVARGTDPARLDAARAALVDLSRDLGVEPELVTDPPEAPP